MNLLAGLVLAVIFFAAPGAAPADEACQKCTHDMQVQYRKCLQSGKDQAICAKEEQETAQKCITVCNTASKTRQQTGASRHASAVALASDPCGPVVRADTPGIWSHLLFVSY